MKPGRKPRPVPVRFWEKVAKGAPCDCWTWTAARSRTGYGLFNLVPKRGTTYAHRVAYELAVGPIPQGLVVDHICRVRHCVNPAHLRVLTDRENVAIGVGPTATNARKTRCKRGHEFTPENTGTTTTGNRYCIRCAAMQSEVHRLAHVEETRAYKREWARRRRQRDAATSSTVSA